LIVVRSLSTQQAAGNALTDHVQSKGNKECITMLKKEKEPTIETDRRGENSKERPFHTKLCTLLGIEYPIIQGALGAESAALNWWRPYPMQAGWAF
jgi:hypothetical protein